MTQDRNQDQSGGQETMQGNLREKPAHAGSFADNQYAGEKEPGPDAMPAGDAGGANVSKQGGGTGSSKQGGNTGTTTDSSG